MPELRDDLAGLLRSVPARGTAGRGAIPQPPPGGVHGALEPGSGSIRWWCFSTTCTWPTPRPWRLLHYLAHGCAGDRVLVVATARPAELADRRKRPPRAPLEQDDLLRRLTLEPLGADALADLAAGVTGERATPVLVEWVEQRSRGNPLYAIGLLRALLEEGANLQRRPCAVSPKGSPSG